MQPRRQRSSLLQTKWRRRDLLLTPSVHMPLLLLALKEKNRIAQMPEGEAKDKAQQRVTDDENHLPRLQKEADRVGQVSGAEDKADTTEVLSHSFPAPS